MNPLAFFTFIVVVMYNIRIENRSRYRAPPEYNHLKLGNHLLCISNRRDTDRPLQCEMKSSMSYFLLFSEKKNEMKLYNIRNNATVTAILPLGNVG